MKIIIIAMNHNLIQEYSMNNYSLGYLYKILLKNTQ